MKTPITGRTDAEIKKQIEDEAPLRGHSASVAIDHILKIGLPIYLEQFPRTMRPIGKRNAKAEVQPA
jgi:hypothetical protein